MVGDLATVVNVALPGCVEHVGRRLRLALIDQRHGTGRLALLPLIFVAGGTFGFHHRVQSVEPSLDILDCLRRCEPLKAFTHRGRRILSQEHPTDIEPITERQFVGVLTAEDQVSTQVTTDRFDEGY